MKTTQNTGLQFYQHLGKLFYAFAAVDHTVREEEVQTVKEIVKNKWLDADDLTDVFASDAAFQIEIVFEWLLEDATIKVAECYQDFVDYKNEHKHVFTPEIKQLILQTAIEITESFSGKNKSELMLLAKLEIELKKD